jgi:hypothetical protein
VKEGKEEHMRGQTIRHSTLLFITTVAALAAVALAAWAQAPLDPQSLVGEWSGTWQNKHYSGGNGQYHLTIERVEGNKVYGQVVKSGQDRFNIVGTLAGNRLKFGGSVNPTEVLIEGNQMKGSTQGAIRANPTDITLTKTK